MRVVYPDLVYGAIASSGVTYATVEDWQYFDIIRQFAPADCIQQVETTITEVDDLLSDSKTEKPIKALFGLANLTHNQDFASLLSVRSFRCILLPGVEVVPEPSGRVARQELGPGREQQRLCDFLCCAW